MRTAAALINEYSALMDLIATRSMLGTRSSLRALEKTGFITRNRHVYALQTMTISGVAVGWRRAKQNVVSFLQAVRILFYSLKKLGDVTTPGFIEYDLNDGLNRSLAARTLQRLGIKSIEDSYFINA